MYLTLPLPSTTTRTMTVTVFYSDGSGLPTQYTVTLLKHGCCKDLSQALSTTCCLRSDESLLLAEVYEHRTYRYLENPSEPLPSIKDDEHIVAYGLPKRAELTRLEICHRYLEKCLSDNFKGSERKLLLTPLVTYLEDTQTGADIDLAISRVLSPLRKKTFFSSTIVHSGKENGSAVEAIDESANIYATHSGPGNQSMDSLELEEMSYRELSFQLCITDNRGLNCRPISKDSLIKTGQLVKVMLDWTDKEHKLYDSSYLKDVPEVHKTKLTVKKTRQEAISLFSCLDAFLNEEPLGPDDMW
ncbi:hypothetical protein CsSME_00020998 [Camellia sinensis var. sinensis]